MSKFRIQPIAACCALLAAVTVQAQPQARPQPQPPLQAPSRPDAQAPAAPQLQPPAPPPDTAPGRRPPADHAPVQTIGGAVRSYLLTPAGDVDGLLLEDGTQVDVPPHLSAQLTGNVHVRDRVEVSGVRAPGSPLLRATEIRDSATSTVVRVDGPPQATPPARAAVAPALSPMTATGRIVALLYTPRGDVGGALTQDGTQVRFPPQAPAGRGLSVGKPLYARGFGTQGPQGRAMEAVAVGSNEADAQAVFSPPAARPGPPLPPGANGPDGGPPAPPRTLDAAPPPADR